MQQELDIKVKRRNALKSLTEMFPDADPSYLEDEINKVGTYYYNMKFSRIF